MEGFLKCTARLATDGKTIKLRSTAKSACVVAGIFVSQTTTYRMISAMGFLTSTEANET